MGFFDSLGERIETIDSILCVGLDPDPARLPEELVGKDLPRWAFNRRIIDATHEVAAAYKPNAAFYEDSDGWRALEETIAYAHGKGVPVVLDGKRADIGNTTRQYAQVLEQVDAVTVNPYMGRDSLQPFLATEDAGVFVLCRTSNPGGADIQDLPLKSGEPVYERVAALTDLWNEHGNVGLVVGATHPDELESLRATVPDLPFLVPGVGSQGGDAEAAVTHGLADGVGLVNSSRGIIFAWENAGAPAVETIGPAAGQAARQLAGRLNDYRN
ncbi:MAG: orotidine-5'-phosphate decarboxylase [Natrialbaceae archaeon]|nr:orotidine-5'-phosphate decarboxylase [Natrialbaceae archaeon]